jgi:predicted acetyltransferase
MDSRTYSPTNPVDLPAVSRMLSLAFGGPADATAGWVRAAGIEHMRVVRSESHEPVACHLQIPMGQYFGGKSVPLVGIAGVAVPPERRGRGLALSMMKECVREIASRGVALSGLYASTQALYRQVGYEQAGERFQIRVPVVRFAGTGKARDIVALGPERDDAVARCYNAFASRFTGPLDRGDYIWNRIRSSRGVDYHGFGVMDDGDLGAYVYLASERKPDTGRQDLMISDIAFTSASAARQIIAFLADFEPMADDVVFHGSSLHPLLTLLPQQRYKVSLRDYWLIRVTDVAAAFRARGYPAGLTQAVTFNVRDDLIESNNGLWTLRINDGAAEAERGGDGARAIACDVRSLASIYAGLYSCTQAALLGMCEGPESALRAADAVFAGNTPWMSDMY